jgi:assimilatory nitrate reductase electron transfer subunit
VRGRYAKLVIRNDRVAGAILVGTPDAAAMITQLYDGHLPVPSDRLAVLLGRALPSEATIAASPAELPASAVVCRCNSVSKGQLVSAWRSGAGSVTELASATRATTGCGSCREVVCGIAEWLSTTT